VDGPFPPSCAAKFKAGELLASGSYGTVFLATQINLRRTCVVKLLTGGDIGDHSLMHRFLAEARLTAGLTHPNIVRVLDHGFDSGLPWIAYEYLPGGSLRVKLQSGPIAFEEVVRIGIQVARALREAHSRGVIHRDVKPDNVMIDDGGDIKVIDFGLAKWLSESLVKTQPGLRVGSPAYMAPEVARGETATARSDLYSLGVLLVELLSGQMPAPAWKRGEETATVLLARISSPEGGEPHRIVRLVRALLQEDPDVRPMDAAEVCTELESVEDLTIELGESRRIRLPAGGRRGKRPTRPARPSVSSRVVLGGIGALIVLFLIFATQRNQVGANRTGPDHASSSPSQSPSSRSPSGSRIVGLSTLAREVERLRIEIDTYCYQTIGEGGVIMDTLIQSKVGKQSAVRMSLWMRDFDRIRNDLNPEDEDLSRLSLEQLRLLVSSFAVLTHMSTHYAGVCQFHGIRGGDRIDGSEPLPSTDFTSMYFPRFFEAYTELLNRWISAPTLPDEMGLNLLDLLTALGNIGFYRMQASESASRLALMSLERMRAQFAGSESPTGRAVDQVLTGVAAVAATIKGDRTPDQMAILETHLESVLDLRRASDATRRDIAEDIRKIGIKREKWSTLYGTTLYRAVPAVAGPK